MKNIFFIAVSMVLSNLFMMENEREGEEAPMVVHKSKWSKFCEKYREVRDFTLTNPLVGAVGTGGAGYGVHLGVQKLNKKDGKPCFEWLEKHKKKVGIGVVSFSALLGFGTITMMFGEKRELLRSISSLKKEIQEVQEERESLLDVLDMQLMRNIIILMRLRKYSFSMFKNF